MATIGSGWVDGAWIQAGWVTSGNGAWANPGGAPAAVDATGDAIRGGPDFTDNDSVEVYPTPPEPYPIKKY